MFLFKVDGCTNYTVLNETDRAQGNTSSPHSRSDNTLVFGWYRFQGAAGDRMADKCVLLWSCGTLHPGWLNNTQQSPMVRWNVKSVLASEISAVNGITTLQ